MILGLACALGAALLYGVAAVGQASASRRLPAPQDGLLRLARAAAHDRVMVAVVAAYLVGAVLHLVAIDRVPLYLAQAGIAASLPVTALTSARVLGERLQPADWTAMAATVGGIAVLASTSGQTGSPTHDGPFIVGLYAGLAALLLLGLTTYRGHGPLAGATLGLLGGLCYSGTALSARLLGSPDLTLHTAALLVLIPIFGTTGFVLYSFALQRVAVTGATAPLILAQTVAPSLAGVLLLGDQVSQGGWPLLLAGLALALVGAIWLAGFAGRTQRRIAAQRLV